MIRAESRLSVGKGVVLALLWFGCQPAPPPSLRAVVVQAPPPPAETAPDQPDEPQSSPSPAVAAPEGLEITDLVVGTGAQASPGTRVEVHYVGTLDDGTQFDSTHQRGVPFSVDLGKGYLIRGFEQGVTGMRVGGVRRVRIPPHLAYGERGKPPTVPPQSALTFELELLDVR